MRTAVEDDSFDEWEAAETESFLLKEA